MFQQDFQEIYSCVNYIQSDEVSLLEKWSEIFYECVYTDIQTFLKPHIIKR